MSSPPQAPTSCRLALHLAQNADGSAKLEIVEMNRFKHLVHLTLSCTRTTDEQLRRHLAGLINSLKVVFDAEKVIGRSTRTGSTAKQ